MHEIIEKWRERLSGISWFMRGVSEKIARMANDEEGIKGRLGRAVLKSQALLDETAVLSCMAYVEFNPARLGMVVDLVDSDFTSIQQRLLKADLNLDDFPEPPMIPFDGSAHTDIHTTLSFTREDYFDLVDKTERVIREYKRGFIRSEIPSFINQLGTNLNKWIEHIQSFSRHYAHCVGESDNTINFAAII
ncbi:hypothetical protein [Aurantivibrio plasticivorans]